MVLPESHQPHSLVKNERSLISDSCTVPLETQVIIKHCNDYYSQETEDRTPLNLPGWIPINSTAQSTNASDLCPAHGAATNQMTSRYVQPGAFLLFIAKKGKELTWAIIKDMANPLITALRQNGWIDRYTRAVLLEFTIYNRYTGYLSITTTFSKCYAFWKRVSKD